MTKSFRAGMIGAARVGGSGGAAALSKRGLAGAVSGSPFGVASSQGLFDAMLSDFQDAFDSFNPFHAFAAAEPRSRAAPRGTFVEARFRGPTGGLGYKLYTPACAEEGAPLPLVVMLHGCSQSPDDFAAGTRMNDWAEQDGFLVCYPAQTAAANGQRCWNWFLDGDQRRDSGEPALVAGITREVMALHGVDPDRVYVAGLSAGGALAATMGQRYPDLYAAVGVHSGLACGAAHDLNSAWVAMRDGGNGIGGTPVPTVVFHGDRDTTVHPANADEVVAQAVRDASLTLDVEDGARPGGRTYRRTRYLDAAGRASAERWTVHGTGHAWSGGSSAGSYTDPQGPDASGEMLRFFAEHVGAPRRGAGDAPRTPAPDRG